MSKDIQITLTGKKARDFLALKKRIESETGLPLSNTQVLAWLMVKFGQRDVIE